ncbi:hypothetical protein DUI87_04892 [Hirundo rustica rustica]|uniref:Endonuclease/exonuclease/phosphatase domain-containing protein n=1 Tax=Hirundo rustica rustica TaxID=333673 RepID=A0A3M0KYZ8_HIRRU|nr:hypothetical protein DUI87_04892 [Hirundo rustica rustica]
MERDLEVVISGKLNMSQQCLGIQEGQCPSHLAGADHRLAQSCTVANADRLGLQAGDDAKMNFEYDLTGGERPLHAQPSNHVMEGLKVEGDAAGLPGSRPQGGKPESGVKSVAQLRCMYTNAHNMGNKEEELEAMVQQHSYDVVAITETWWDESHSWSTALDGYKLFRRDRRGRRGGGVALYIKKAFDTISIETNEGGVECVQVRIKGKANKADILLGVCYCPPNQEEEVDKLFYKWLENVTG